MSLLDNIPFDLLSKLTNKYELHALLVDVSDTCNLHIKQIVQSIPRDSDIVEKSVYNLEFVKYLLSLKFKFTEGIIINSVKHDSFNVLKWIYGNKNPDNIVLLKFIKNNGYVGGVGNSNVVYNIVVTAIQYGKLDVLRWICKDKYHLDDEELCNIAAEYGQLEILKWLHEHYCPWNFNVYGSAAGNGHLDIIKYAHENNCPIIYPSDFITCHELIGVVASQRGYIHILEYMKEQKWRWHDNLGHFAAENGQLAVLQWIHTNIAPCNTASTYNTAVENYQEEIISWLDSISCPRD